MKSSQAWSLDIMLAIVIFIGTIFVFYAILSNNPKSSVDNLEDDAAKVLENIASEDPDLGFIDGIEINQEKLQGLLLEDYEEIKKQLRVENDFCIFLEDENGNVIKIDENFAGIGSSNIQIGEDLDVKPCG